MVRYSTWDDVTYSELGLPSPVEFTPAFVSKMRLSTPFEVAAVALVVIATVFAITGHCNNDHKTLVACGLYIIGGLTLGGGLVMFASVLSDVYLERPRRQHVLSDSADKQANISPFDYKYGWSYFAAGAAFVMSEVAAVLNISAYLRRFPTVEDMVRAMVPGAERRLREHQGLTGEYLVQHRHKYQRHKTDGSSLSSGLNTRCYSKSDVLLSSDVEALDGVEGPLLLSKTAPDICSTNASGGVAEASGPEVDRPVQPKSFLLDEPPEAPTNLAGHTVPIVLMHHRPGPVLQPERAEKRFSTATLPHKDRPRPGVPHCTGTLPSKHFRGGVSTLDGNVFAEHLHKKFTDLHEFEGHMTLNQRFGSALSHLSSGLDSGTGTLVGTFHAEGLIHSGVLGVAGDAGTPSSSTTSSLSSSKPFQPHKKKSVTIGSVFSTMDTFEASKVEDELFGGASAV